MYDDLAASLRKHVDIEEPVLQAIFSKVQPLHVSKHDILLTKGDICTALYFISQGCLRTYYVQRNWQESTRLIALEGSFFTVLPSFVQQEPSSEYIQALEDSVLLCLSRSDFELLTNEYCILERVYLKNLEQEHFRHIKRMEGILSMTAKDRYKFILEFFPEIIARVSNRVIATYLGITQESLSRLKSQK
jgi:CRP-like cAMP-binding protein